MKKQFKRVNNSDLLAIIFLGVVGVFINQWSFFKGTNRGLNYICLNNRNCTSFNRFLASLFLKEKLTLKTLIGSLVAIIGIYFVVTAGKSGSLHFDKGLLWIVVTMITFSIMIIMTRSLSQKIDPLIITLYTNIVGFVVSVPFAFILDSPLQVSSKPSDWLFLIITAVIVHGMANLLWNQNIRYVDAAKASILSNLEPFVAMVMGFVLLSKPMTMIEIIGSVFIVGGVVFSTYQKKRAIEATIEHAKAG